MHRLAALSRSAVVAIAVFSVGLSACGRAADKSSKPPAPTAMTSPAPAVAAPPALSRADLLQAMEEAATTYASGQAPGADKLVGRRFTVRQAFGCFGPPSTPEEPTDGLAQISWKGQRKAIELSLTPGDWTGSALVTGGAAEWEAVEGVWLTRPWLRADGCPGVRPDPLASGPPTPSPQTMGLAAVYEVGGSRLGQRNGRAYSFVVRGKDGQAPAAPEKGFRLVIEGRLASFADGRAIHCQAASPDQRPVCIAAGRLDRIAFEDAAGSVLSEWRPG